MNDLLNEEEFLSKEYNPWKWYNTYSLIIICVNILLILVSKYIIENNDAVKFSMIFSGFISPILFASLATFYPKKQLTASIRNRSFGLAQIYIAGSVGVVIPGIIIMYRNIEAFQFLIMGILILLGLNTMSYAIITVILNTITKMLNRKKSVKNERPA
nr:hypothetical protein [uncultured Flavobacterium sp.]